MESNRDVDAYISACPQAHRQILEQIREIIKTAAPEAKEIISYQMPTFYLKGNLVHFAAAKHHLGFYPSPSGISAFKEALAPYKTSKGAIQFPYNEPLPEALISDIVRFRVQENLSHARSKGKPKLVIRPIETSNQGDINLPNEAFDLVGTMVPSLKSGQWRYEVQYFETPTTMRFPDENYDFDAMKASYLALGAYLDGTCVGLAILEHQMFKHLYLYDLKVSQSARGHGVGTRLIEAAAKLASKHGYLGLFTIAQDNNLKACQFYLKNGFEIGGVNTHVYRGTSQADKTNIYFYRTL